MFCDIVKMTQAPAQTRDEAEGLAELGIDSDDHRGSGH